MLQRDTSCAMKCVSWTNKSWVPTQCISVAMSWSGISFGLFQSAPLAVYSSCHHVASTPVIQHRSTLTQNVHSASKGYRELYLLGLPQNMGNERCLMTTSFSIGKLSSANSDRKRLVPRASSEPAKPTTLIFAFFVPLLMAGAAAVVGLLLNRRIRIEAMEQAEEMERLRTEGLLDATIFEKLELEMKKNLDGKPNTRGTRNRPRREE